MFKKTIKYEDFNGVQQEKDFYFHLSKTELLEMAAGDMQDHISRIIITQNPKEVLHEMRNIVLMAVGRRSEDGSEFIKDGQSKSALVNSGAYDELLMELATQADSAAEFIRNLLPTQMQASMTEAIKNMAVPAQQVVTLPDEKDEEDKRPQWLKEGRPPSERELMDSPKEFLTEAFRLKSAAMMNQRPLTQP